MKSQLSLIFLAILFADTNGLLCFSCGNALNCDVYSASIVSCPNDTLPTMNYCFVVRASSEYISGYDFNKKRVKCVPDSLQRGCANADYCQVYENNTSVTCNLCGNNKCNGVAEIGFGWVLFGITCFVNYIMF